MPHLRWCPRVKCWNWGRFGHLKGYKKRGEVSFSHGVMKHFIRAFLQLCSTSDIINLALYESKTPWKKLQHCSPQTNSSNVCTFLAFFFFFPNVFVCKPGINYVLMKEKMYKFSLAVCCCLHCVLRVSQSKAFFFLTALRWTLAVMEE